VCVDPPIVLDGVVSAARQHLGYLSPLVAYELMLFDDDALLQCKKQGGGCVGVGMWASK
jgi:hypothetical protein